MIKKLNYWQDRKIVKPQKVKVKFWATTGTVWLDKNLEKLYNELLSISDDIDKLQDKIYKLGTEPQKIDFRKKGKFKSYTNKSRRDRIW